MAHIRDIVVTGVGMTTHLGADVASSIAHLRQGRGRPFDVWDRAGEVGCRCHLYGKAQGEFSDTALQLERTSSRFMGRASRLALRASTEALAQAGLPDLLDVAVAFGSGAGDTDTHIDLQSRLDKYGLARRISPTVIPRLMASTVSANLVNCLRTTGPSMSISAACAGGAWNIIGGAQLVSSGHAKAALVGGVEVLDLHFHTGFDRMHAYNGSDNDRPDRASRPYAADRAGFIFGEGAGALVLERRGDAMERGATILGVVRGWGMSSDGAGEMVKPSVDGPVRAIRQALAHANMDPADVDYVNTHATSTPAGDVTEVHALWQVFGKGRVPYSSTKGYTGHCVSGAGAVEAIFTLQMLREGWIAGCLNADPVAPELIEDPPVRATTHLDLRVALSNSFGFGGTNVCLALGRA